jgi:hypothetical protein
VRSRLIVSALGLLLGVAVALTAGAAGGATTESAANSVTYPDSDPAPEDPTFADITGVIASNDDAGNVTIQVNIGNRATLSADMLVAIFLDTDKTLSTGLPAFGVAGADYVLNLRSSGYAAFSWDSATSKLVAISAPPGTGTYASTGATFRFNVRDFGKTRAFAFYAVTATGVGGDTKVDLAPSSPPSGIYNYDVKIALKLSAGRVALAPKPAKAGKLLTVRLPVTENDPAGPIAGGQVSCAAAIAGRHVVAKSKGIASGSAFCTFAIPKGTAGKTIRGSIGATDRGAHVQRSFSAPIR